MKWWWFCVCRERYHHHFSFALISVTLLNSFLCHFFPISFIRCHFGTMPVFVTMKKEKEKKDPNEIRVRACESIPKIIFIFYSNVKFYLIIGSIVCQLKKKNTWIKKIPYILQHRLAMQRWISELPSPGNRMFAWESEKRRKMNGNIV